MKQFQLFYVRILKENQKFIDNAVKDFNLVNDCFLALENIDENQIITFSLTNDCELSELEIDFLIFGFGSLFPPACNNF